MKVYNINGINADPCKCGSWLQHWKKFSGQLIISCCSAIGCSKKVEFGAHVQRNPSRDDEWYIVPFCNEHNHEIGVTLNISNSIMLVSANVDETCGK